MKLFAIVAILAFSGSVAVGSPTGVPPTLQKRCSNNEEECFPLFASCCGELECKTAGAPSLARRCRYPPCPDPSEPSTCPSDSKGCASDEDCEGNDVFCAYYVQPQPEGRRCPLYKGTKCCQKQRCGQIGESCDPEGFPRDGCCRNSYCRPNFYPDPPFSGKCVNDDV